MRAWNHFMTITHHKFIVMRECFQVGLYKQGILHDLSKFSWTEFKVGCKYYQGNRSPNNAERETTGMSLAWLHHKGRNKHHYEYWIDYGDRGGLTGMKMPKRYVVEMFMDRVAASKIYLKKRYTDQAPREYYDAGSQYLMLHEDTRILLEKMLNMLAECGEKKTFAYIKKVILKTPRY